ncbi:hypothetical protein ACGFJ7_08100 [Actinoplanes sp. NPDC048988]|uniref:hypothetical protein n=1 Tax=Actinoplanes sp. NPDC048988 TaxID=3363901 RepID=UPI0037117FEA
MTTAGWFALGITVFGSLCYATASILQAVGARRSVGTVRTMAHPLYMLGLLFDILAWIGAMIALRELAVYVVESILAGSLAITVLVARFALDCRLRKRDAAAVVVTIASLSFLALSAGPQDDVHTSDELRFALCAAAMVMVLVGWGAAKVQAPGGLIAAFAGLSLGGAALIGRSLPVPEGLSAGQTALAIVTEPLTLALLTFAATGMMLYAHALQHGDVGPVTAIHWTAEVCAPSVVAMAFLGDTVREGWLLPAVIAGVATVTAAVVLATAPATHVTAKPEESAQPALAQRVRAALPAPEIPAWVRPLGEKVIWWGAPPIWRPPNRAHPIEPAYRAAAVPSAAAVPAYPQSRYQHPQPHYAQPQYGQPQYGQPQYWQPQHGQPQYGQAQHAQSDYPQPAYMESGHPESGYPHFSALPTATAHAQASVPPYQGGSARPAQAEAMVPPYQGGSARPAQAEAMVPPYQGGPARSVRAEAMVPPYQAGPAVSPYQEEPAPTAHDETVVPPYQGGPAPTAHAEMIVSPYQGGPAPTVRGEAMVPPYQARPLVPPYQGQPAPAVRAEAMVPPYQSRPTMPPYQATPAAPPAHSRPVEPLSHSRATEPPAHGRPGAQPATTVAKLDEDRTGPAPRTDPRWWSDPAVDGEW